MRRTVPKDLTGFKFGRLTVLRPAEPEECTEKQLKMAGEQKWLCQCDCGTKKVFLRNHLLAGTRSCGCARVSWTPPEGTPEEPKVQLDPQLRESLKTIWNGMRHRCYSDNYSHKERYRDRGITMYSVWRDDFMSFVRWALDNGYRRGLSIDRVDPDGNYTPSNCRWITMEQQQRNKIGVMRIDEDLRLNKDDDGTPANLNQSIRSLAQEYRVPDSTIRARLKKGWNLKEALTGHTTKAYYYGGKTMDELSMMIGIPASTLRARMTRHGENIQEALLFYARKLNRNDLVNWVKQNVPAERDTGYRYPKKETSQTNLAREREVERLIAEDLAKADAELREEMRLESRRLLGEEWEPCVTWND